MENFLKGREQTQRFKVNLPQKEAGFPLGGDNKENLKEVVRAEKVDEAVDAPEVDLVLRDGVVQRIIVHLPDGRRLELECEYS